MSTKKKHPFLTFLLLLIALLFLWSIYGEQAKTILPLSCGKKEVSPRTVTPAPGDLGADERNTIDIFEKAAPAVVFIKNAAIRRDFFSLNVYEIPQGAGSGFVWDEEGHVVTNFHVIYQADKIEVTLADQKSYSATVVGAAPEYDLAVLHIDAPKSSLAPIPIGTSSELRVGQKVLAIGNPFGLDHSLSTGVISALGRNIESLTGRKINDVIQTDTAINPGNSGGPLLDSFGRIIGINTAIYSPSGGSSGVGFAVPIDTVNRVIPQLIAKGKVTRAGLGVTLVPDKIRKNLKLQGSVLLEIGEDSAAKKAGLQGTSRDMMGNIVLGDMIIAVDGERIKNNDDLIAYFERNKQAGDKVVITFLRDNKKHTTEAMLQEL